MAEFARRKKNASSRQPAVSEHDRTRDQKPRRAHDSGRNALHRNADAKISRSPKNIDQSKSHDDLPSTNAGSSSIHGKESRKNSEYQKGIGLFRKDRRRQGLDSAQDFLHPQQVSHHRVIL